jgi:hypothetical protein
MRGRVKLKIVKFVKAVYDAFRTFWLEPSTSPATSRKKSSIEDSSTHHSPIVSNQGPQGPLEAAQKMREALEHILAEKGIVGTAELLREQFNQKELKELKKNLYWDITSKIPEINLKIVLLELKRANLDEDQRQELERAKKRLTVLVRNRKKVLKAVDLALKLKSQNPPDVEKL